jgi:hypothetical protein
MFSEDGKREACVVREGNKLLVDMFERNDQEKLEHKHQVDVSNHSEHYAEDAAENWVTYVIRN